jgi:hypothetical protein
MPVLLSDLIIRIVESIRAQEVVHQIIIAIKDFIGNRTGVRILEQFILLCEELHEQGIEIVV